MTKYLDDIDKPSPFAGPPKNAFREPEDPPDGRPVISRRPFWTVPGEQETYEHAVRANPKRPGEGPGTYIARIASIVAGRRLPQPGRPMPRARLGKAELERRVAVLEGQREPGSDDE